MTISFNEVPANTRIPFTAIEVDPSGAQQGPTVQPYKILVIGQRSGGSGSVGKLYRSVDETEIASLFGAGSQIHRQSAALFANNKSTETWFVALADPTGNAATEDMTVAGTATEAGTIFLYVGGQRVTVAVANGDDATTVATAVVAAVTAKTSLPVTASNALGVVTFTAKNDGICGNDISLSLNVAEDEKAPDGLTVTGFNMAGGTGVLDLSSVYPLLGDEHFTHWVLPALDTTELGNVETELADRYGPMNPVDAHAFTAYSDTYANTAAIGAARNSPHVSMVGTNESLTPTWEWAAAFCGVAAFNLNIDPARPLQTLEVKGVLPPARGTRWDDTERNLLLFDGISTFRIDAGGRCRIERAITMYQKNAFNADDTAFLDLNSLATLSALRYDLRNYWALRFPRHKLRADGARIPAGQKIMTPKLARAEIISRFRQWEDNGWVEGIEQFKDDLIVEINASDPNRLDIFLAPDLVNQLRLTAMQMGFKL